MKTAIADESRLHKEIGNVLRLDRKVDDDRTRRHVDETPVEQHSLADLVGEQHPRIVLSDIQQQVSRVADLIRPFISNDFEVVEPVHTSIELWSIDPKHRVALNFFLR